MFKIDCPWNYLLYSTSAMLYVIFHKRGRVFYQGLQTRENNKNQEAVKRVIFIVLSRVLQTLENNENDEEVGRVLFIVLEYL